MSHNSSRRTPTPFHYVDDSRTVLSSPRTSTSRSSASTALSSWIDDVSSRSASPSPSQWVIPLPPSHTATEPPRLLSHNPGHGIPPIASPTYPSTGHYPPAPPPGSYASPPVSDHGSVSSSRHTSSSAHTRSSARDRPRDRDGRTLRPLDTIPCQICLEPATACRCVGGKNARRRMREAAQEVFNRAADCTTNSGRTERGQGPQVAPQVEGPAYAQRFGYGAGYDAPAAYPGSPVGGYPGQPVAMGGCAAGYYGNGPVVVSTSQTGQQDFSGPVWGIRGSWSNA